MIIFHKLITESLDRLMCHQTGRGHTSEVHFLDFTALHHFSLRYSDSPRRSSCRTQQHSSSFRHMPPQHQALPFTTRLRAAPSPGHHTSRLHCSSRHTAAQHNSTSGQSKPRHATTRLQIITRPSTSELGSDSLHPTTSHFNTRLHGDATRTTPRRFSASQRIASSLFTPRLYTTRLHLSPPPAPDHSTTQLDSTS